MFISLDISCRYNICHATHLTNPLFFSSESCGLSRQDSGRGAARPVGRFGTRLRPDLWGVSEHRPTPKSAKCPTFNTIISAP
jgi:hypothetical protein